MEFAIIFFDPNFWIFSLGINLTRKVQFTENHEQCRIVKELEIGLLILSLHFKFFFKGDPETELQALGGVDHETGTKEG